MLRVQSKRRPEDWDKKKSILSGRFLPMDPRDEAVLDVLERNTYHRPFNESYSNSGSPDNENEYQNDDEMHGIPSAAPRKWSKRSEAARKRWSDPEYRAKMLEKRAANKRLKQQQSHGENGVVVEDEDEIKRLEIGCMDSITLSDDNRANAINAYARSNQLRSEKITAFHRNQKVWMEERLKDSPQNLTDEQYVQRKLDIKQRRREAGLKRARIKLSKKNGQSVLKDEEPEVEIETEIKTDTDVCIK